MKEIIKLKSINDVYIESDDIALRLINKEDLEIIRQWRNLEVENRVFLNSKYIEYEQQINWFTNYIKKEDDITFLILFNNKPIGMIALYDIKEKEAEFGRLLVAAGANRGKNIGLKATKLLCDFGFNKLELKKIKLEVFKDNYPAVNIYKKAGFIEVRVRTLESRILIEMEKIKAEDY